MTHSVTCVNMTRRDNKKCEETRPCGRCLSRQEECISLERTQTIVKKRCLPCRTHNRKVVQPIAASEYLQAEKVDLV